MSMERMGLVSRVEEELEQTISLGLLPKDGFLPSEQLLARRYGVSRATAREALLRLAARGLVVQHPGRRSRPVPLSEAVTLENLSVALHGESPTYLEEQRKLEDACFALWSTAPWEDQWFWTKREFELMRLAALTANLPGHFLLVRTLERSFRGMAGRLLPHLDCEAIRKWSLCAFHALCERDVKALQRELPTLLNSADEPLLDSLAPANQEDIAPLASQSSLEPLPRVEAEPASTPGEQPGAILANRSACQTGSCSTPPIEVLSPVSACISAGRTSAPTASEKGRPSVREEAHGRPTCSPAPLAALTPSPASRRLRTVRGWMDGS